MEDEEIIILGSAIRGDRENHILSVRFATGLDKSKSDAFVTAMKNQDDASAIEKRIVAEEYVRGSLAGVHAAESVPWGDAPAIEERLKAARTIALG